MSFAVIVQARTGSSRLPGKILEMLGAKTALERCLDRCRQIPGADLVVAAIPDIEDDDELAEFAADKGYFVSRGSEKDVLSRYARAAREADAETVMRVTSDCPFIDPQICGETAQLLASSRADYACNNMPPRFPHGLDCDIFPAALLHEADRKAHDPYDREHVTPWLRTNPNLVRAALLGPGEGAERLRWTLDYPEDLQFCRDIYAALGEAAATVSAPALIRFCMDNAHLLNANEGRVDEARLTAGAKATLTTARKTLEPAA